MWTVVISGCVSFSLVMSLAFCLCWRKKSPKNDLLGLDGMVIQKNPDENVNHLPSAAPCVVDGVNASANSADFNDSNNKRNIPANNTRRSLPDIPSEQGAALANWEPTGDNSSEHYATVGQYQNAKRHTLQNGVEPRPSLSQHSSITQADDNSSPYEKVKYDKIKSKEHPYAQLQPTTSRQAALEENKLVGEERTNLLRPSGSSTSSEPSAPPRSRRSSAHSGLGVDIPAASAVAGGIAASPELPYMTPPVTQPNFSGDSQDSSKGYTSISVREPLANIIAQTKEMNKKRDIDQHYSTVSDDSDDVYTTIPDPNNQIYTSESETYARIPAHPITVEAEVNPTPRSLETDEFYEPAPQPPPPSVTSLKQVAGHSHSRQASSSSSIANIGSPKPEKRQANSPLPPPPPGSSFDFQRNLDDLYAKVHKNKKKEDSDGEKTPEKAKRSGDNTSRKSVSSCSSTEEKKFLPTSRHQEHNYETLRKSNKDCSDPGYEKIRNEEPGYASINGPESITSSDPGYEVLKQRPLSELDPNYEELKHRNSNASDSGYSKVKYTDGYSVVNKQKSDDKSRTSSSYGSNSQDFSLDEPNYESMPSESLSSEHNYAALKSGGSESDPNYESVRDLEEPPYEKLNDGDSDFQVSGRGYENIDTSESSNGAGDTKSQKSGPPYEHLNNDTDSEVPGYERIKGKENASSGESSSSGANKGASILEEDAIFQV
ncbi:dentin sialophosphoprotein isoform X2 [Tribolium castaneum]|uniref:dentin sialophosphoprotein isoform X2 n=1 Tax=Tribolium castaneum TaxID=7070 RepID=UPI00046C2C50|nr:PREDICTED: dentin sialophosphoprotein isoform X2 [Tribolium castaneum]|eukprot:XP_008201293.1 PREDICTED: dentin sialophosphoprotein isoform X2 [Tribolium castaneum]